MSSLELTYRSFITRISEVGKKDSLFKLLRNGLLTFTAFILIALVLVSLEAVFEFSSGVRMIMFFGFISAFSATVITILGVYFLSVKSVSSAYSVNHYARQIGSGFPGIKDNLLNALQLYDSTKKSGHLFSGELAAESINCVNNSSKNYRFADIISFKKNNPFLALFISSLLLFTSLLFIFPGTFLSAAGRIADYNYTFVDNSLGIAFEVTPGSLEITRGENVDINARILFNDPAYTTGEITFFTKTVTNDGIEISLNEENISAVSTNEFTASLNNINSNTVYWFSYKGIKSSAYNIIVTNKPVIKSVKITVYPPAYTKLPSRTVDGNEISAIYGSIIYVELEASDELSKGSIFFGGATSKPFVMQLNGKNAVGSFNALSGSTFKLGVSHDFNGKELSGTFPQEYILRVFPDEYPKISILEPESSELNIQGRKDIEVRSRVTDDFGFSKMRLGYKLVKSKYGPADTDYRFADIPVKNTDATGLEVPYIWNLSVLNLGTEDEVEYFVEVYDNDAFSGPKMSRSEVRRLVYPSLESLLKKTEQTKDEVENSLKTAFEEAMELKKELDEIKEHLEKNPEELGLNDPVKNREMQQKLENVQNNLSSTQKKLDDLMKELQQNKQISEETLQKYMELQKLFQKIDSQELRDALKKLQEAMKNFNKEQLTEAIKNFKFDEENFKKSLEKTMELLNKIMNEQKFGELTEKLDEITKKQEELKNETKKTDKSDNNKLNEHSKTQEQLREELKKFNEQLKELSENMNKMGDKQLSKEMKKLLEEMMKRQIEQKMQKSAENLQQGNKDQSEQKQEEISDDLGKMNEQMQQLLMSMIDNENKQLMAKMQEFLDRLKEMSKKEGELMEQSDGLDKNSDEKEFQENKQQQDNLQNRLSNLTEEMMSMAQQMGMSPMMSKNLGDAYNEMQKASDKLGKKDGKGANKSQGNAKESLDKALERMQQMCNSGNPGSGKKPSMSLSQLLQQLQQMIQRQQGLNQQMQGMQQNGNQGQMTQQQMAEMQRLAMEQETIKQNVGQLNEEFKKQQELEGKKMLGNLDQVQKDMNEIIKDLQENNITPETMKRQEKILSRMLDFQLSTREKDFEQRRESRPGKNFTRSSPPEIIISKPNIINGINQEALELQKENYTEDYEALIQKYMEKIKSVKR